MANGKIDIIEIENIKYALIEKFILKGSTYFILNQLTEEEEPTDNTIVLKEIDGLLYEIEEEQERQEIESFIQNVLAR